MAALPTETEQATQEIKADLAGHYAIMPQHIKFLRENGYIKLKNVLRPETIDFFAKEISAQVKNLNSLHVPMEQRTTYQKAFLQVMNIWRHSEISKQLVFSKRLARMAAELLQVSGVRLYHDQALYKEPGGGITPWHADQYYWPVSSDRTVTVWIPLQATPHEMGPLAFARSSHRMAFGRDLEISNDSEALIQKSLHEAQNDVEDSPFDLGEVSFHLGWTFHRAGANTSAFPREVMTIIYVDENIRLAPPQNKNQEEDRATWCEGVEIGEILAGPLNPVLWSTN
ncbi:MAG: phytanoyl-CoA dioxygenase family protein [Chthoniobacterales bacterium]